MRLVLPKQFCGKQTLLSSAARGGDAPAAASCPCPFSFRSRRREPWVFPSCNPLKSLVQKRMPVMCGVGLLDAHAVRPLSFPPLLSDSGAKLLSGLFAEHAVLRHALVLWAPHHGVDQCLCHAHHSAAASQVLWPAPQIGCPPWQVAETRTWLLQQCSTAYVSVGMGRAWPASEGLMRHSGGWALLILAYVLRKLLHSSVSQVVDTADLCAPTKQNWLL